MPGHGHYPNGLSNRDFDGSVYAPCTSTNSELGCDATAVIFRTGDWSRRRAAGDFFVIVDTASGDLAYSVWGLRMYAFSQNVWTVSTTMMMVVWMMMIPAAVVFKIVQAVCQCRVQ